MVRRHARGPVIANRVDRVTDRVTGAVNSRGSERTTPSSCFCGIPSTYRCEAIGSLCSMQQGGAARRKRNMKRITQRLHRSFVSNYVLTVHFFFTCSCSFFDRAQYTAAFNRVICIALFLFYFLTDRAHHCDKPPGHHKRLQIRPPRDRHGRLKRVAPLIPRFLINFRIPFSRCLKKARQPVPIRQRIHRPQNCGAHSPALMFWMHRHLPNIIVPLSTHRLRVPRFENMADKKRAFEDVPG
mmetsp:Transcript_12292/g.31017  ORF Transcript_12292/g.31017 Transcript_12292/m.31017 type:complete len:241 (+) Transcript_12292:54-776(+)